jgi:transcription initiation factor TFIIIB Brf1 subunit/transcription initiation factor TFIIB
MNEFENSKTSGIIDGLWDEYKNYQEYLERQHDSDSDSEFDDTDGNYCINDDCCRPSDCFVQTNGFILCNYCGTAQDTIISDEKDWNNYADGMGRSQNNGRCAGPNNSLNPFKSELTTFIPKGYSDNIQTRVCKDCGKYVMSYADKVCRHCNSDKLVFKTVRQDLSKLHMRFSYNHREKSFDNVKTIMEGVSEKYPQQLVNTALTLWGEIMIARKLTRAGVRKGLIACCVYYSCLHHGCPRTPIEICKDFQMSDTKDFNKGDKEFRETFETSEKWSHMLKTTSESEQFFIRFCSLLELEFSMNNKCINLYNKYDLGKMEVIPKSAAAGIIYYICTKKKIKLSKTTVSKKLGVCNPTLTKTVKLIEQAIRKKKKADKAGKK